MATDLKPPTSLRGYVDDQAAFGNLLADWTEQVPDVAWPNSPDIFRQMRLHPQLAAVEKAYTLPIRRASWSLNPAGCKPTVVQLVADDLGLPIAGKDKPTAARVRGVSWAEHLRLALLCLPYGHSVFELLAEIRGGKARLVELSERLPSTITEMHTDTVGRLTGITQFGTTVKSAPQIGVDRLAFYSREREGAAYWGRSILRPAYPAWRLSREMLRVTATGHSRFSMGVPNVEWAPGSNPTQAQINAAEQVATSARVGETAGASMPPGARLVLTGLSGGTPDTVGFLRYLDQVMARQALAGFLDLGTTETGSRALAGEFIDLFKLALMSEALFIADEATRQIAARIVEWNFGPDEAVPAIQVADIGSSHEVTAESIQLLLSSGALSADPGLEQYLRKLYKLPERPQDDAPAGRSYEYDLNYGILSVDERRAQIGLPPLPDGKGAELAEPAQARLQPEAGAGSAGGATAQGDLDWGLFGGGDTGPSDGAQTASGEPPGAGQ